MSRKQLILAIIGGVITVAVLWHDLSTPKIESPEIDKSKIVRASTKVEDDTSAESKTPKASTNKKNSSSAEEQSGSKAKNSKESKTQAKPLVKAEPKPTQPTKPARKPNITSEADDMLRLARVSDSKFTVLKGSRLVERRYGNDGDSFLVKHNKGETDFRLYFVDTPESWYKASARGSEKQKKRLKEQGDYFGGLDQRSTIQVGIVGKKFVKKLLLKKPFTVVTKHELVYSGPREYAFIIVEYEGKKRYLHEILVAKGLARIHTIGKSLPDSTSSSRQRSHLRAMEKKAKAAKIGAWSIKK